MANTESNAFERSDMWEPLIGTTPEEKPQPKGSLGQSLCQACKNCWSCIFRCLCRKQVFMALAIVSAIVLAAVYNKELTKELNIFMTYCKHNPFFAPLLFAGAVAALTIVMMPTVTLFIGAGYLFPAIYRDTYGQVSALVIAIASVSGGLSIGSMIAFALGRSCFKEWAENELKHVHFMTVVNKMVEAQGWWIVFLARMSPLMPAEIFNYVCSLTTISFGGFAFGSLGSIAPISIWIISSAAGFDAATQAEHRSAANITNGAQAGNATNGMQDESDPGARQRKLMMIAANVVFLFVISYPMYRAYKKFEQEAVQTIHDLPTKSQIAIFGCAPTEADAHKIARCCSTLSSDKNLRMSAAEAAVMAILARRSKEQVFENEPAPSQLCPATSSVRGIAGHVEHRRSNFEKK